MNFDADKKTVATLLKCDKIFEIPRFQREYSWEKSQLKDFFEDIATRIVLTDDGQLATSEYFWGTTLFVGSFTDANCKKLLVVDGQQRLTTITIFLSCIRKAFLQIGNSKLAETAQSYIMGTDNNGDQYAILKNETPYPYFQETVQAETATQTNPTSEEEKTIQGAVEYFSLCLRKDKITKRFQEKFEKTFALVDIYKVLRDQLLNSVIIVISTQDKTQANMIFEILNAKGKSLDQLDLIKNQIFSVITNEEPSDEAKVYWKRIKDTLNSRRSNVDMSVFFNHYWTSRYNRTVYKNLYKKFKAKIRGSEADYFEFLKDLAVNARYYVQITNPKIDDFNNRVEYRNAYHYLNFLNDINIKQSRILILVLFSFLSSETKLISATEFIRCLKNLCIFHFIFNGLYSQGTNLLESIYASYAVAMRALNTRAEVNEKLNSLYIELGKNLQRVVLSKESLIQKISDLKYSAKSNLSDNVKTKFFIRLLYEQKAAYPVDASLEHILNENLSNEESLLLGNIIPFEMTLNNSVPNNADYRKKIEDYYAQSTYPMMIDFLNEYGAVDDWDSEHIQARGRELANSFCDACLSDFSMILQ